MDERERYDENAPACRFNEGVACWARDRCLVCGWCPPVEEARKRKLHEGVKKK